VALPFENVLTDRPIKENKLSIYRERSLHLRRASDPFLQTAKKIRRSLAGMSSTVPQSSLFNPY